MKKKYILKKDFFFFHPPGYSAVATQARKLVYDKKTYLKKFGFKIFFPKLSIVFQSANNTNESEMRRICNCVQ